MLPTSMLGFALATLVVVGCGGRRTATQEKSPGAGGARGEVISGGAAGSGGGAGGKGAPCHLGDVLLAEGETVPRDDCNICLCQWSGELACTDKPCSCVERYQRYGQSDSFRSGTKPDGLPTCLPTCGVSPRFDADPLYSIDALPKGSCDPYPYAQACVMAAHGSCLCPNERGPVNGYACSCVDGDWACSIHSQGLSHCSDLCIAEAADAGNDAGPGACELTRQLSLTYAGTSGDLRIGETVGIHVLLSNPGPRDHGAYPGAELAIDSPYFEPVGGAPIAVDALYGLTAKTSGELEIRVKLIALPAPCSQIIFHLRVRSFGEGEHCLGSSLDAPIVLPLPSNENCPACPPGPTEGPCSPSALSCKYPGGDFCDCMDGRWQCGGLAI